MISDMKYQSAIVSVALIAALAIPHQCVAGGDRGMADSAAFVGTHSQLTQSALKNDLPTQPQIAVPYVGAGFGGGYASELNRSLVVVLLLLSILTPGFEISLGKASLRMSSKWASAFHFE